MLKLVKIIMFLLAELESHTEQEHYKQILETITKML